MTKEQLKLAVLMMMDFNLYACKDTYACVNDEREHGIFDPFTPAEHKAVFREASVAMMEWEDAGYSWDEIRKELDNEL